VSFNKRTGDFKAEGDLVTCAICESKAKKGEYFTVRQRWLNAGGFGRIPDSAIVHVKCDEKEQKTAKLVLGKIEIVL